MSILIPRFLNQLNGILDYCNCAKTQKIHFQHSQLFQSGHGKLCRNKVVIPVQRHKISNWFTEITTPAAWVEACLGIPQEFWQYQEVL